MRIETLSFSIKFQIWLIVWSFDCRHEIILLSGKMSSTLCYAAATHAENVLLLFWSQVSIINIHCAWSMFYFGLFQMWVIKSWKNFLWIQEKVERWLTGQEWLLLFWSKSCGTQHPHGVLTISCNYTSRHCTTLDACAYIPDTYGEECKVNEQF